MPSTSKKQARFMAAVAHSPEFAKQAGVPMSVGKDFNQADKGRKFAKGGDTMATKMFGGKEPRAEEMQEAKALRSGKMSTKQYMRGEKSEGHKEEPGMAKTARAIKSGKMSPAAYAKMETSEPEGMKCGGKVKKMAGGGLTRGDGIAQRGKTKGRMI